MLSLSFFLNVATDVDDFKGLFRSFQILTDLYANERCPETVLNNGMARSFLLRVYLDVLRITVENETSS